MNAIEKHLSILGKPVRDRVIKIEGIATSVSFDLYGCVQVVVNRGVDKEGKLIEPMWFDIARLEILSEVPVMDPPEFAGDRGPAEKPPGNKP